MAIRRPGIGNPNWLFQDFLYFEDGAEQQRYIQVKYDGEPYTVISETFDYSNPPYSNADQRGGDIVAQLDYSVIGQSVTIESWDTEWRDEWPLRLAVNYLRQCLYPASKGYVVRVIKNEAYAFWVSEQFFPVTNLLDDYLYG
jgi:hypothetical protein